MGRRFKPTTVESHDWDTRADRAFAEVQNMPDGAERAEALRKIDQLRAAADMRRLLSRTQPLPPEPLRASQSQKA